MNPQVSVFRVDQREFARTIMINFVGEKFVSFDVFATRAWTPVDWERVPLNIRRFPGRFALDFVKPIAISFVKIVVHGQLSGASFSIEFLDRLELRDILRLIAKKKIAFVGCARNCSGDLTETIRKLNEIGSNFESYLIHVFENDSVDDTVVQLELLERLYPGVFRYTSVVGLDGYMHKRTARLAYARNLLIDIVRDGPDFDYVCVLDLDGIVRSDFDEIGFFSCFSVADAWDGVFPVCNGSYYDMWAMRHNQISPDDYTQALERADRALGDDLARFFGAFSRSASLKDLDGWLSVSSAFGGLAVYKASSIGTARYVGLDGDREVCEHVSFNLDIIRTGGALYINPQLVVASPPSGDRGKIIERLFRT